MWSKITNQIYLILNIIFHWLVFALWIIEFNDFICSNFRLIFFYWCFITLCSLIICSFKKYSFVHNSNFSSLKSFVNLSFSNNTTFKTKQKAKDSLQKQNNTKDSLLLVPSLHHYPSIMLPSPPPLTPHLLLH